MPQGAAFSFGGVYSRVTRQNGISPEIPALQAEGDGGMRVELSPASIQDAALYTAMQREAFAPLLARYQDALTNPANETAGRVAARLADPGTDSYLIRADGVIVGAASVNRKGGGQYRLGRLFVLPSWQGHGVATQALRLIEARYPDAVRWELDTIAQEAGNRRLYEKVGYRWIGRVRLVNRRMALVDYVKRLGGER